MNIPSLSLAAALLLASTAPAMAADVGVSVSISQPGVYGRIDIGQYPQPQLIVPQPVWVARPRTVVVQPEPVYMWVPPGHRQAWSRYCGQYQACGRPVYFVQDGWYRDHVMAGPPGGYRDDGYRDGHPGRGRGHGRGHDR